MVTTRCQVNWSVTTHNFVDQNVLDPISSVSAACTVMSGTMLIY